MNKTILRTIDANFNRSREGLRVCEDVARFILDDKASTHRFKALRHEIEKVLQSEPALKKSIISARNPIKDVGKKNSQSELKRKDVKAIFEANLERSKEAVRVLEEFLKLVDKKSASRFKNIRFKLYNMEKNSFEKLGSLRNIR